MLFIISLLNLEAFDFKQLPVWIWFISYITYPIISIWLTWRQPKPQQADALSGPSLPAWAKGFLLTQGIVVSALAVLSAGTDVRRSIALLRAWKPVILTSG
ncbi:MAG: hypothetical protein HZB20_04300 [Chloroflexi bacterium]|nr:hypothetical protein [Chloroflexota bacterium]